MLSHHTLSLNSCTGMLSKCLSMLLYGLEACHLDVTDIRSIDFVINGFLDEGV